MKLEPEEGFVLPELGGEPLPTRRFVSTYHDTLREELPHESMHETNSWASASALTDGERVYAFFGSRGLTVGTG